VRAALRSWREAAASIASSYQGHGEHRPVAGYSKALATYAVGVVGLVVAARRTGLRAPERIPLSDMALLGISTFRASRLLTKSAVASPLRAPFTTYVEPGGPGEVTEEVTAEGDGHAVGELLTCPFCLAQWIATTSVAAYVVAPRQTRLAASVMTVAATSDVLQLGYSRLQP
jgi:hypothetical protein